MEIDNETIAVFMGYEYIPFTNADQDFKPGWWKKGVTTEDQSREAVSRKVGKGKFICRNHKNLKYHSSWDWLMPVVEKIESLELSDFYSEGNFSSVDVNIEKGHCYIYVHLNYDPPHRITGMSNYSMTKINLIYSQVLEFIKYYDNKFAQ